MSFKSVASSIAKRQGEPMANANAELAAATRRAGPAARKKNPKLNRVKGKAKAKGKAKKSGTSAGSSGSGRIANIMAVGGSGGGYGGANAANC